MSDARDKLIFRSVILYLPFSILLIFWLYLVSLVYTPDSWQYRWFYGEQGNHALLWLLLALLPAFGFLIFKIRRKAWPSRVLGAAGFYCLLASLLSSYHLLVWPGLICIFASVLIGRKYP